MKTFNATYTFANGDSFTLEFKGRDQSKIYGKASAHASKYYGEYPARIEITEKMK